MQLSPTEQRCFTFRAWWTRTHSHAWIPPHRDWQQKHTGWSAQMPLVSCCAPLLLCSLLESLSGMWSNQTNGPSDSSPLTVSLFLKGHPAFSCSKSGGERVWDAPRKEQLGTACNCEDNLCSLKSIPKGSCWKDRTGSGQTSNPGKFLLALGQLSELL